MARFVGLDVSQKLTAICVVDETGRRLWRGGCATDPGQIERMVKGHAGEDARIGVETGPMTPWLVHELRGRKLNVVCLDARHASAALRMQLNKTDQNDAEGLAQIMRTGWYRPVHVKSLDAHRARALLGARAQLVGLAAEAEAAADGAVQEAAFHLVDTGPGHWAADGRPRTLRYARATVRLRLDSEAGKLNPNTASPALLAALLGVAGTDSRTVAAIAEVIVSWRYLTAQGGGLILRYRAAGLDYAPPGARFQSLDELGLVLGMTPALLERLCPDLSLFHDGNSDPSRTTPAVQEALRRVGVAADAGTGPDDDAVTVTAAAEGQDGTRFTRRAVLQLGAGRDGSLFRVLD